MEVQLGEVDLLLAMYPDDEIQLSDTSRDLLHQLRQWCDAADESPGSISDVVILLWLRLTLDDSRQLELNVSVPVAVDGDDTLAVSEEMEIPKAKVWARQPSWMSKAEVASLNSDVPNDDILGMIEFFKEAASHLLETARPTEEAPTSKDAVGISRIWFYFPSISTRGKRDDIVNYAPTYGLTGFLLAGKPGMLCLEGDSQAIDNYMKFIKTESWKDIPSQHKKVSERHREVGPSVGRAFPDMQEITDEFTDTRRGARGNRNDMSVLKGWLTRHGVGDMFEKVFI